MLRITTKCTRGEPCGRMGSIIVRTWKDDGTHHSHNYSHPQDGYGSLRDPSLSFEAITTMVLAKEARYLEKQSGDFRKQRLISSDHRDSTPGKYVWPPAR